MSYFLRSDPKDKFDVQVKEILDLSEEVKYGVALQSSTFFENHLKDNKIKFKLDSYHKKNDVDFNEGDVELAIYLIPYSEFVFVDAEILQFDFNKTFSGVIAKLAEAIETIESKPSIVTWNVHPKNKTIFEQFLFLNDLFYEFIYEDENKATYIVSDEYFVEKMANEI